MKRKGIAIVIIIILVFSGLIFFMSQKTNRGAEVKTQAVTRGDIIAYFSTSGTVQSINRRDYYVQTPSKVLRINFNIGDRVKKGDIIAQFDVQDLSIQLQTAQKQYENAKIQLNALKKQKQNSNKSQTQQTAGNTLSSALNQYQSQSGGTASIDDQIKMQQNQVDIARLNVLAMRENISKQQRYIRADFNGVLTALNIKAGNMTNPAMPAASIEDISNLQVIVNVNQYDITKIRPGLSANINFNNRTFRGVVQSIDPVAVKSLSPTGGDTTVRTVVKLLQNDGTVKSGFDVDVDIKTGQVNGVLKIPAEAVITDKEGNESVYVVENNIAKLRRIKTGLSSDIEVEVGEGLKEGEKVILNPPSSLGDGSKVFERNAKQ